MCEIIRGEMSEGRNVPLDLRGAKSVWGETWDIPLNHRSGYMSWLLQQILNITWRCKPSRCFRDLGNRR